jgi:ubiquinone/menaquinone biosynthesis C-methylase UbiE
MNTKKHSEAVLSDLRDDWWNTDFLELLAARMQLPEVRRVADLGCGQGHWGLRLLPFLNPEAKLEGLDQEGAWIDKATRRVAQHGLEQRCHYQVGEASKLPFADHVFDLVTCQTLLLHLSSVADALREMARVLGPGKRLLLVEPSNLPSQFTTDTVTRLLTPTQVGDLAKLFFATSRGRANLGRGDDSIGDVLPGMLKESGFTKIEVWQNEKAQLILPPYDALTKARLDEQLSYVDQQFWLWNKEDAQHLFEAGGGTKSDFEGVYATFLHRSALFQEQVEKGIYACSGGAFHYLITAIRSA